MATTAQGEGGGTSITAPYSPAWYQQQADLVRSGNLDRETTRQATAFQLQQLGLGGYTNLYPEVYEPGGAMNMYGLRKVDQLNAQVADLRQMQLQFSGPEATYIRWLIQNRINGLRDQIAISVGNTPAKKTSPLPMPDWLMEYLETSMPAKAAEYMSGLPQEKKAGKEPLGRELRPIGAQAELTPEQMGLMASYQAWGKAGSPVKVPWGVRGEEEFAGTVSQMADWQRYWDTQVALSEKLFPQKTKLRTGWATALQR